MRKGLSVRKFAESVGVSHVAVLKAIKAGRLVDSLLLNPDGTMRGIDPEKGKEEWAMNSPAQVSRTVAKQNDPAQPLPSSLPSYAQARAVRENYQARIAKLIYEEKIGKLVEAEGVKTKSFELARLVRDVILGIPPRIAAELAAETDPDKIFSTLTKELTQALSELSDRIEKDGPHTES